MKYFCRVQLKNKEVSSANKLGLDDKSSGRSLIYIKKNDEPRMGHWRTLAKTLIQNDAWSLRTTLLENSLVNREDFPKLCIGLTWVSDLHAIVCQKLWIYQEKHL